MATTFSSGDFCGGGGLMRSESSWRSRAVAFARHAAGAAGLGLGWLLLAGSPATALGDLTDFADDATSSVVATVSETAAAPVKLLPGGEDAARSTTGALSGAASTTTSSVASVVETAPAAVEPVLPAPLEPLVPVLEETTGAASALVEDVGGTATGAIDLADAVVTDPGQILPLLPATVSPPASESAVVPPSSPAETTAVLVEPAAPEAEPAAAAPIQPVWEPTFLVRLAASGLALTPEAQAVVPALGAMAAWPDAVRLDVGPVHAVPASPGTVGSGGPGGSLLALASGAFLLALLWRAGPRLFPASPSLPRPPAFDPGSTPD